MDHGSDGMALQGFLSKPLAWDGAEAPFQGRGFETRNS